MLLYQIAVHVADLGRYLREAAFYAVAKDFEGAEKKARAWIKKQTSYTYIIKSIQHIGEVQP